MRLLATLFLLHLFSVSAQDTIITNYKSGTVRAIEYRGESMRLRRDQKLPVRIVYNQDSTIYCELYYELLQPQRRIWYENNIPVFGESGHCHNFFYENGILVRKTTRNAATRSQVNCVEERKPQQYSMDNGTFENFILNNGTISYYTVNQELTATIEVKNGRRVNDAVIFFKDSSLFRQIRNMPNHADLNENHHIERSEASCITTLVIRDPVQNFTGLQHFPNLKVISYLDNYIQVSEYASFTALITKLSSLKRQPKPAPWAGAPSPNDDDSRDMRIMPIECNCAQSDAKPIEFSGEIYDIVEQDAQFVGGYPALMPWIDSNLVITENAIGDMEKNQGKIYVSFVVEIDGSISTVEIMRGLSKSADSEVIRLIKSMPKWIPAQVNNVAVRSRVRIPVRYMTR